ncbi:methyltransferase domain-containing protein [Agrobacterium vaccinii]|uniref:class I SAM-dependent methyltransferase n=1 Tax=Agrobacterium vaccinii TaxID=2735528 RepID=UPI001E5D1DBA|nr:methyltransferase domain-containing protein [Agrobacterium vaccinii]UHS61325.1 methyltransferase domain-containing protein [Agrobacterium vaccinii]
MLHSDHAPPPNPANASSARFFGGLGIPEGSRVLDIGCGNGDLSRLMARIVGPDGVVVAIDSSEYALQLARNKESETDAAPIDYRFVDLASDLPDLGRFDVIVGRRVLMYLPDASSTLSRLVALGKPGGILAFQEHARGNFPFGLGDVPLHRRLYDWAWNTVAAEGGDVTLGLKLIDKMSEQGLSIVECRNEGVLIPPNEPSFLPTLMHVMLPRFVEHNVCRAEDVQIDTLRDRIEEERRAVGGTIVWDQAFLVAGKVPG